MSFKGNLFPRQTNSSASRNHVKSVLLELWFDYWHTVCQSHNLKQHKVFKCLRISWSDKLNRNNQSVRTNVVSTSNLFFFRLFFFSSFSPSPTFLLRNIDSNFLHFEIWIYRDTLAAQTFGKHYEVEKRQYLMNSWS